MEVEGMYNGNFDGNLIWKVPTIPKLKYFLWQCHHKSILVCSTLAAKRMHITPLCHFSEEDPESIVHVLRDCRVAQTLWTSLSPPMPNSLFFGLHLTEWLRLNYCKSNTHSSSGIRWDIIFSFGV